MKLWLKLFIALILGAITGISLHQGWLPAAVGSILAPIGAIFLSLISMIIVLLVFSSMTVGIANLHDPQKLGRIGFKTVLYYIITTLIAIAIGLLFAKLFKPGIGLNFNSAEMEGPSVPTFRDLIMSIIPSNPVASLANGHLLQIIVFSIFLGIAINFAGERGKPLFDLLESLSDVMLRLTSIIMEFSPIGVFALMATVTSVFGAAILPLLLKFGGVYLAACLFHILLIICGMLYFLARLNPISFFKGMRDAMLIAFSTSSSSATLPVTIHCVQRNLGVSKDISNTVLPFGSVVNMNGSAIFLGMGALAIAQAYGIDLNWQKLITILLMSGLSSIGLAGVPGAGLVMLSVVLASVGLPLEGIALLAGIDRLREMFSTVLNVLLDSAYAVFIAKKENEFDERQYNHETLLELEENVPASNYN